MTSVRKRLTQASTKSSKVGVVENPPKGGFTTPSRNLCPQQNKNSIPIMLTDINTLPLAELKAQLDRLALAYQERQKPSTQDRDLGLFSDAVHSKITDILAGNIAGNTGPLAVRELFRVPGIWGPILAFLQRTGYAELPPAQKVVIYSFLAELVVRHAYTVSRRSKAPLSPKLVASCSGNLGGLFEREFPGYLRSGLAKIVASRMCSPVAV